MQPKLREGDAATVDSASSEQSLADLLEQVTRRLDEGGEVDVEVLAREHPQHADRLRELMPTMLAMASWGRAPTSVEEDNSAAAVESHPAGVLGDFRIAGELGRGGMGTVFEAEQISMGRRVALKVLPFAALAHGKALQRFRNEVRAAAALDHPNIVSVYSVGEERGIHYYSMQLVRGQTVGELIRQARSDLLESAPTDATDRADRLPDDGAGNEDPTVDSTIAATTRDEEHSRISTALESQRDANRYRTAARFGVQAAQALQHAHEQGVLHRDIKPGNLMLDRDGQLYITDFGLARIEADAGMTMTGDIIGTLRYMAPEQAMAKRVVIDHRADIYSLGATLYELITLRPAVSGVDRSELLKQIAFEEPMPPRKLDRHLSVDLETIILKALEKSPDDRYQTAQELADDLQAFLEDRPIHARPPTTFERAAKWSRRHVVVVWALIAILLTVGVALAVSVAVLTESSRAIEAQRNEAISARKLAESRLDVAFEALDQVLTQERHRHILGDEFLFDDKRESPLPTKAFWDSLVRFYRKAAANSELDVATRLSISRRLHWIAKWYANSAPTEYLDTSCELAELAIDYAAPCVEVDPSDAVSQRPLRAGQSLLSGILDRQGMIEESLQMARAMEAGCDEWRRLSPKEGSAAAFQGAAISTAANALDRLGDCKQAYTEACRALEFSELAKRLNDASVWYKVMHPRYASRAARFSAKLGLVDETLEAMLFATEEATALIEQYPQSYEAFGIGLDVYRNAATACADLGRFDEAAGYWDGVADLGQVITRKFPNTTPYDHQLNIAEALCEAELCRIRIDSETTHHPGPTIRAVEELLEELISDDLPPRPKTRRTQLIDRLNELRETSQADPQTERIE